MLAGALLLPALPLVIAARDYGRVSLVFAAATVSAATACGRVAFDSLLQRDGAESVRGRAFARFETRFQLVWVAGGVGAVVFPGGGRGGIFVVAVVLLFGGLSYVGAFRRTAPSEFATVASARGLERADAHRDPRHRARRGRRPARRRPARVRRSAAPAGGAPHLGDGRARPHASRVRRRRDRRAFRGRYSFEMTMPGGALLPVAAVSWVSVQPTHRRRGVLTQLIAAMHDDARARDEPAAILTASESSIYGRFGYGIAAWQLAITAERAHVAFARESADDGRMRLVDARRGRADAAGDLRPRRADCARAW